MIVPISTIRTVFGGKEGKERHTLSVDIRMIVPTLSVDIRMIVPISDYQDCVWGEGGQGKTYTQC